MKWRLSEREREESVKVKSEKCGVCRVGFSNLLILYSN